MLAKFTLRGSGEPIYLRLSNIVLIENAIDAKSMPAGTRVHLQGLRSQTESVGGSINVVVREPVETIATLANMRMIVSAPEAEIAIEMWNRDQVLARPEIVERPVNPTQIGG